jgi:hypothetical protein
MLSGFTPEAATSLAVIGISATIDSNIVSSTNQMVKSCLLEPSSPWIALMV